MVKRNRDMIGKKFGRLTVISAAEAEHASSGREYRAWLCRCDCGRERIVRESYLKNGSVTHCGKCSSPISKEDKKRICRYCEYSTLKQYKFRCSQGRDPTKVKNECDAYYCAEFDKITNVRNRESKCFICGKPVYSHGTETPIYCKDHRAHADKDNEAIQNAPYELLFLMVAEIFLRAKEDYLFGSKEIRADAMDFLKGEWAQELSVDGFDVKEIFESMDTEMINGLLRTDEDIE